LQLTFFVEIETWEELWRANEGLEVDPTGCRDQGANWKVATGTTSSKVPRRHRFDLRINDFVDTRQPVSKELIETRNGDFGGVQQKQRFDPCTYLLKDGLCRFTVTISARLEGGNNAEKAEESRTLYSSTNRKKN